MPSSSLHATTRGHAVQNASSIWCNNISAIGFSDAATACSAYCLQREHLSLWVIVMNPGMPSICHNDSCHHFLNTFEAHFNLEGLSFSWMSISGHQSNGSVVCSHLMEVVWIKPQWYLFKHLCSYKYCTIWNSAEPNKIMWISHDQLSCMHCSKSWGCVTPLSSIYVSKVSNFLQESIGSHVMSPDVHLTCNSKLLLVHLWANISSTTTLVCHCYQNCSTILLPFWGTICHYSWHMVAPNWCET